MFLRNPNIVLVIGCAALSALGFHGFYINARSIPEDLRTETGVVVSAEMGQRKNRIHTVWFTLEGNPRRFAYPGILPRIRQVWEKIEIGSNVEVVYSYRSDPKDGVDLWGLSIASIEILTPAQAREARLKNGYFALALGFAFAGCAAYTWQLSPRGRRV